MISRPWTYRAACVLHRGSAIALLVAIVGLSFTEGPNPLASIYLIGCSLVIEVSWRVTRSNTWRDE